MAGMASRAPRRAHLGLWLPTAIAVGLLAGVMGAPALTSEDTTTPPTVTVEPESTVERASAPTPPPAPPTRFTLVATGDVLPHAPVVSSATTSAGIDFSPLTEQIRPYIAGADLALCHMEVPVAPPGTAPSGYPMFGSPREMVPDLAEDGWDGCSAASNHSVDRRKAGIETTLAEFAAAGMGATGISRTETEAMSTQMYVIQGDGEPVNVAHISLTYDSLNGLPKPPGEPWAVDTFNADASDADPVIAAAQRARDAGADVVIASVHCCVEYRTEPTAAQRLLAERIAASGVVDLYVGHHAHVPQPIELLPGGPQGDGMWVAFGLGNYLSNQDTQCCVAQTNSGVLLTATFTIDGDKRVTVEPEWTPITVDRLGKHRVYALTDIPDGAGRLSAAEVAARIDRVAAAVGGQAPMRTTPAPALARSMEIVPRDM